MARHTEEQPHGVKPRKKSGAGKLKDKSGATDNSFALVTGGIVIGVIGLVAVLFLTGVIGASKVQKPALENGSNALAASAPVTTDVPKSALDKGAETSQAAPVAPAVQPTVPVPTQPVVPSAGGIASLPLPSNAGPLTQVGAQSAVPFASIPPKNSVTPEPTVTPTASTTTGTRPTLDLAAYEVLNLRWLPADTEVILHLKVSALAQAPLLKSILETPEAVKLQTDLKKILGLDLADIESLTASVPDFNLVGSAGVRAVNGKLKQLPACHLLTVIRSKKPMTGLQSLQADGSKSGNHNGKTYAVIPAVSGIPTGHLAGWLVDDTTAIVGELDEVKSAMDLDGPATLLNDFSFVDPMPHVVVAVATNVRKTSPLKDLTPEFPTIVRQMTEPLGDDLRGLSLGMFVRGGVDAQTSLILQDADSAAIAKTTLDLMLAEIRTLFAQVKATAPLAFQEMGISLLNRTTIEQQVHLVRISTALGANAQTQLEQLPMILRPMIRSAGTDPFANIPKAVAPATAKRKQIVEADPVDASRVNGLPDGTTLSATIGWSSKMDGKSPAMQLTLQLNGVDLSDSCGFGDVTIKTLSTDGISRLKVLTSSSPACSGILPHASEAVQLPIQISTPTEPDPISVLEGTFVCVSSMNRQEFSIEEAPKRARRPLTDPALKTAGVKLLIAKESTTSGSQVEVMKLSCGKGYVIIDGVVIDAALRETPFHAATEKDQFVLKATAPGGRFDDSAVIKFKLCSGLQERTVSFRFENVPVPDGAGDRTPPAEFVPRPLIPFLK